MSAIAMARSCRGNNDFGSRNSPSSITRYGRYPIVRSKSASPFLSEHYVSQQRSHRTLERVLSVDIESNTGESIKIEEPDCRSRCKRIQLSTVKYTFVCLNVISMACSAYVLFSSDEKTKLWVPEKSLIILGLFFGLILSGLAIRGGVNEELYLVLTSSITLAVVFVLCSVYTMIEIVVFAVFAVFYVIVCAYLSLLLYWKPEKAVLPELMADPIAVKSGITPKRLTVSSRSSVPVPAVALDPQIRRALIHSSSLPLSKRSTPDNNKKHQATKSEVNESE